MAGCVQQGNTVEIDENRSFKDRADATQQRPIDGERPL